MDTTGFVTVGGTPVPAVTAAEMAEIDRVAVGTVGLRLLQMMENAGRNLARHVRKQADGPVVVAAGSGGNGGGGLACARHLANRDISVDLLLDRPPGDLEGAVTTQFEVLEAMGVSAVTDPDDLSAGDALTAVDALIGYGLSGPVHGRVRDHIEWLNGLASAVVSLDVPSGRDATTGEVLGVAVEPNRTVTLALPKTGLEGLSGTLYLADIAIPATVYERVGIQVLSVFDDEYVVELRSA